MAWKRACGREALEDGEAIQLDTEPAIAVFNVDGQFYATSDSCTHDASSLADGYIDGDVVECSWHFAKFCIRTGEVLSLPATVSLKTFPVKVLDDDVLVDVPD
jgi:3-phenylpropionate/trans-cinnamate dioxygenase ferredoxin component